MSVGENGAANELSLVKLYMELTGAPEAVARSVFMYVSGEDSPEPKPADSPTELVRVQKGQRAAWRSAIPSSGASRLGRPVNAGAT